MSRDPEDELQTLRDDHLYRDLRTIDALQRTVNWISTAIRLLISLPTTIWGFLLILRSSQFIKMLWINGEPVLEHHVSSAERCDHTSSWKKNWQI